MNLISERVVVFYSLSWGEGREKKTRSRSDGEGVSLWHGHRYSDLDSLLISASTDRNE